MYGALIAGLARHDPHLFLEGQVVAAKRYRHTIPDRAVKAASRRVRIDDRVTPTGIADTWGARDVFGWRARSH
eukprot:scaffold60969_cov26-Tisochrysis_lutea.AAC.2